MNLRNFIILMGVLFIFGWQLGTPTVAQERPPDDTDRRPVDTASPTPPAPTGERGASNTPPSGEVRDGANTNPRPSSGEVRQRRQPSREVRRDHGPYSGIPAGGQSGSSDSLSLKDTVRSVPRTGSADVKWNTPCGSPKCLGAVAPKREFESFSSRSQFGNGAQNLRSQSGSGSFGAGRRHR